MDIVTSFDTHNLCEDQNLNSNIQISISNDQNSTSSEHFSQSNLINFVASESCLNDKNQQELIAGDESEGANSNDPLDIPLLKNENPAESEENILEVYKDPVESFENSMGDFYGIGENFEVTEGLKDQIKDEEPFHKNPVEVYEHPVKAYEHPVENSENFKDLESNLKQPEESEEFFEQSNHSQEDPEASDENPEVFDQHLDELNQHQEGKQKTFNDVEENLLDECPNPLKSSRYPRRNLKKVQKDFPANELSYKKLKSKKLRKNTKRNSSWVRNEKRILQNSVEEAEMQLEELQKPIRKPRRRKFDEKLIKLEPIDPLPEPPTEECNQPKLPKKGIQMKKYNKMYNSLDIGKAQQYPKINQKKQVTVEILKKQSLSLKEKILLKRKSLLATQESSNGTPKFNIRSAASISQKQFSSMPENLTPASISMQEFSDPLSNDSKQCMEYPTEYYDPFTKTYKTTKVVPKVFKIPENFPLTSDPLKCAENQVITREVLKDDSKPDKPIIFTYARPKVPFKSLSNPQTLGTFNVNSRPQVFGPNVLRSRYQISNSILNNKSDPLFEYVMVKTENSAKEKSQKQLQCSNLPVRHKENFVCEFCNQSFFHKVSLLVHRKINQCYYHQMRKEEAGK